MLVGLSGPTYTRDPGDEHDCDDAEAKRLIAAGFAAPICEDVTERAVAASAPESRPARKARK
jgi:hypothetical protein